MLLRCLVLIVGFLAVSQTDRISLIALPSQSPQNGSRLHLICQLSEKSKFNIMWKRDNQNVGESCLPFRNLNANLRNCSHNKTSTEWILDPVTYDARGLWSCIHGKEIASVIIDVNGILLVFDAGDIEGNTLLAFFIISSPEVRPAQTRIANTK